MAVYEVDSANQNSETLLVAYQNARTNVQAMVGEMYRATKRTETAYAEFDAALQVGGPLESLGEYHADKQASLSAAVVALRAQMAGMMGLMVQMQAGYAAATGGEGILFPGVPTE